MHMWVYNPEQHAWNSSMLLLISGKLWVAMRVAGLFSESEEEESPQVPDVRQGKQDSLEVLSTPRFNGDKACWDTSASILCLRTFVRCSVLARTPAVLVTGNTVCRRNNSSLLPPVSTRSRGDVNHRRRCGVLLWIWGRRCTWYWLSVTPPSAQPGMMGTMLPVGVSHWMG